MTDQLADLFLLLVATATIVAAVCANRRHLRRRRAISVALGVVLAATVYSVSIAYPQGNVLAVGYVKLLQFDRTFLTCAVAGIAGGLLLGRGIVATNLRGEVSFAGLSLLCIMTASLSLLVAKDQISPYLSVNLLDSVKLQSAQMLKRDFTVQKTADLDIFPTAITVDDADNVYVAGYSGVAFQNGVIVSVEDGASRVVASQLNRPHGIAFWQSDLYVSRAGQHSQAVNGQIRQLNTGYITKLQDLNHDGIFDFYQDVVDDLPGAWNPDGLHQNNGIDFDGDGNLYVTVGAPSDHGPSLHPFSGTILKYSRNQKVPEVFAKGFRNPFGIAVTREGVVFCTDNDSSDSNQGDQLYVVSEGKHYGHPYRSVSEKMELSGTEKPDIVFQSAQGLVYVPKSALPAGYDNCLYIASYGENRVYRVPVTDDVPGRLGEKETFLEIERPIDIELTSTGKLLVACCEINSVFEIDFVKD